MLPVSADWEFTKWGMSPEQVVQASNRQARPNKPGSGIPKSVLLTQDWQSGRFLFEVLYLFEKGRGGQVLTRIQLQLKNTELRKELLADLERKYGTPRGYIKEGIVTGAYWEKSGNIHIKLLLGFTFSVALSTHTGIRRGNEQSNAQQELPYHGHLLFRPSADQVRSA